MVESATPVAAIPRLRPGADLDWSGDGHRPSIMAVSSDPEWAYRAAVGLVAAEAARRDAVAVLERTPPPWYRFTAVRAFRRERMGAWIAARRAAHVIRAHSTSLELHGAGADPAVWGVLSIAPGMRLELTLERVIHRGEAPELADAAADLLHRLPTVRAAAALGDRAAVEDVEGVVLRIASDVPAPLARELVDHLPARVRPLPRRVDELEHHGTYKLMVTENDSEIWLHDIVVGHAQGSGFGTSLLQQLCWYADHRGLPIAGTMVSDFPRIGSDTSDEEVAAARRQNDRRLAGWYHRHGFRGPGSVDDWRSFTTLRREPRHPTAPKEHVDEPGEAP